MYVLHIFWCRELRVHVHVCRCDSQWMETWQDFEKLHLLKRIIKLCSADLINYLAQCLFTRYERSIQCNQRRSYTGDMSPLPSEQFGPAHVLYC